MSKSTDEASLGKSKAWIYLVVAFAVLVVVGILTT